ncbi:conserved hypothetical protein [Neospora caninum Liverpool]|uniref:Uncharacterized protein n=1 Tax=Neospora caninum (strain Liverpool) TaxID=572307 RepID=F0VAN1_NEOCL|nr:conserved hypothetical protein [Neospora caninum Liverpool]CBZ50786.1 conserved hypothetical protein [Neospora caninum Liverpool]CEL68087.1 TPA: hypothetical protein BN1204_038610 [Neospora caninum Liverpool]|eukprot:XP_003880819.1 conserved hypothetical protein [Neospora caninum Liverpool]
MPLRPSSSSLSTCDRRFRLQVAFSRFASAFPPSFSSFPAPWGSSSPLSLSSSLSSPSSYSPSASSYSPSASSYSPSASPFSSRSCLSSRSSSSPLSPASSWPSSVSPTPSCACASSCSSSPPFPSHSSSPASSADGDSACSREREKPEGGAVQRRASHEVVLAFQEKSRKTRVKDLLAMMAATDVHALTDSQIAACMRAVADCYVSTLRPSRGDPRRRGARPTERQREGARASECKREREKEKEREERGDREMQSCHGEALRLHTFWHRCVGKTLKGDLILKTRLCLLADIVESLNKANLTLFQPLPLLLSPSPHSSSSAASSSSSTACSSSSTASSSSSTASSSSSTASSSSSAAFSRSASLSSLSAAVSGSSAGLAPVWVIHRFYFRLLERLELELRGLLRERDRQAVGRPVSGSSARVPKDEAQALKARKLLGEERGGESRGTPEARAAQACCGASRAEGSEARAQTGDERPGGRSDTRSLLRIVQALASHQRHTAAEVERLVQRPGGASSDRERGSEASAGREERNATDQTEVPRGFEKNHVRGEYESGDGAEKEKGTQRHDPTTERLHQLYQAQFFFLFFFERFARACLPYLVVSWFSRSCAFSSSASTSSPVPLGPERSPLFGVEKASQAREGEATGEATFRAAAPEEHWKCARRAVASSERAVESEAESGSARDEDETDEPSRDGVARDSDTENGVERRPTLGLSLFTTEQVGSALTTLASALRCTKCEERKRDRTGIQASQHVGAFSPVATPSSLASPSTSPVSSPASSPPPVSASSPSVSPPVSFSHQRSTLNASRERDVSTLPFSSLLVPVPSPFPAAPPPSPPLSPSRASLGLAAREGETVIEKRGNPHLAKRKAFVAVPLSVSERPANRKKGTERAESFPRSDSERFPYLNAAVCLLSGQLLPHVKSLSPATALGLYIQLTRSPFDAAAVHGTLAADPVVKETQKRFDLPSLPPCSPHSAISRCLLLRLVEQPAGLLRDLPGRDIPSFMLSVSKCMPQLNAARPLQSSLSQAPSPPSSPRHPFPLRFQSPASPLHAAASSEVPSDASPQQPFRAFPSSFAGSQSGGETQSAQLAHAVASLLPVLARRLAFEQRQAASVGPCGRHSALRLAPAASSDALTALADAQAGGEGETRRACVFLFRSALASLWRSATRKAPRSRDEQAARLEEPYSRRTAQSEADTVDAAVRMSPSNSPFGAVSLHLRVEHVISLSRIAHAALKLGLLESFQADARRVHVSQDTSKLSSEGEGRNAGEDAERRREMQKGVAETASFFQGTDSEEHLTEREVLKTRQLLAANLRAFSFRQLQYLSPSLLCSPAFVLPAPAFILDAEGRLRPTWARCEQDRRQETGAVVHFAPPLAFQCLSEALRRYAEERKRGNGSSWRPGGRDEWGCRQLLTSLLAANLGVCSFPFASSSSLWSTGPTAEAAWSETAGQRATVAEVRAAKNPSWISLLPLQALRTARLVVHATAHPQRQHTAGTRISALQEDVLSAVVNALRPHTPDHPAGTPTSSRGSLEGGGESGSIRWTEPVGSRASYRLHNERGSAPIDDLRRELRFEEVEAVVGPYTVDCILTLNGRSGSETKTQQTRTSLQA